MCNLNILVRKDLKHDADCIVPFLQGVTGHSFASNHDGEGFYADGKLVRSLFKINYFKWKKILEGSRMIITHQRLATSGYTGEYTQPFMNEDFVFVHNGIMADFIKGSHSDSWVFFKKFQARFKKLRMRNREKKIILALKGLIEEQKGYCSFSIAILDRVTNMLYYLKNSKTKISFFRDSNLLFITTDNSNKNLLELFEESEFREYKVQSGKIFRIDAGLGIREIGSVRERSGVYESGSFHWF